MQYDIEIDGHPHRVVVSQAGDGFAVSVDARTWHIDAARIDAQLLSLITSEVLPKGDIPDRGRPGASYEIAVSHESAVGHVTVGIGAAAVTVKLNGKLVVDNTPLENYWHRGQALPSKGPIELQHHGDKLWFKNIYVKELSAAKAKS